MYATVQVKIYRPSDDISAVKVYDHYVRSTL